MSVAPRSALSDAAIRTRERIGKGCVHRTIDPLRLEKTYQIIESNHLEASQGNLRARTKKLMEKAVQRTPEMEKCVTKGRHWRKLARSVISR